jgi:hypothetical protein
MGFGIVFGVVGAHDPPHVSSVDADTRQALVFEVFGALDFEQVIQRRDRVVAVVPPETWSISSRNATGFAVAATPPRPHAKVLNSSPGLDRPNEMESPSNTAPVEALCMSTRNIGTRSGPLTRDNDLA